MTHKREFHYKEPLIMPLLCVTHLWNYGKRLFVRINMATSKLQIEVGNLLDRTFPEYKIRENYRPDWLMSSNLTRLELDFYIEELRIGFEVQGEQHYKFIDFFYKTIEDFEKRKQYDQEKKDLCVGNKVQLIEIFSLMDAIIEIKTIKENNGILDDKKIVLTEYECQIYAALRKAEYVLSTTQEELARYKLLSAQLQNKLEKQEIRNTYTLTELINDDLKRYEKKAIKLLGKEVKFRSDYIPIQLLDKIHLLLKSATKEEDVKIIFGNIDLNVLHS